VSTLLAMLVITYALLSHGALLGIEPSVTKQAAWLLPIMLALLAYDRKSRALGIIAGVATALVLVLHGFGATALMLFLPPIFAHSMLAYLFGSTLRPGNTPLILRFVRLVHGPEQPPSPELESYVRRVTFLWAALFALLAAIEFVFLVFADPDGLLVRSGFVITSSVLPTTAQFGWFANVGSWAMMAMLMIPEWTIRKRRFPDQPYATFGAFLKRLVEVGPVVVRQWRHD